MVEVRECSVMEVGTFEELPELLAEYAAESSIEGLPAPGYHEANYLRLERSGNFTLLVATIEGTLVGFVAVIVTLNARYDALVGALEVFFVGQEYRKTGAGMMLLQAAEQVAQSKGAIGMFVGAPSGGTLSSVLERGKRYRETNRVFFRSLQ